MFTHPTRNEVTRRRMKPTLGAECVVQPSEGGHRVQAALLASVVRFNQMQPDDVHPSWYEEHERRWLEPLRRLRRPEALLAVSDWTRTRFGVDTIYDGNFDSPPKRLYLLEADRLQQLALWLGASLRVATLRQQVGFRQAQALRTLLGESSLRQLLSAFPDQHPTGVELAGRSAEVDAGALHGLGVQTLLHAAQTEGYALYRRVQIKFNRTEAVDKPAAMAVTDSQQLGQHMTMVAMLFIPQSHWLLGEIKWTGTA